MSENAKSFIKAALVVDPEQRASAEQLLNHDFIKNASSLEVKSEEVEGVFTSIESYSRQSKFNKTIFSVLACLHTDMAEQEQLKQVFKAIDQDHSGDITFEEF